MPFNHIAFIASEAPAARRALKRMATLYGNAELAKADVVVALGGDGHMLQTMHKMVSLRIPVYGMNRGTVGFLMNEWRIDGLIERIARAKAFTVAPLEMTATTTSGEISRFHAINEVSLLRETRQTAWIEVSVNGRVVMPELVPGRVRD